MQLRLLFFAYFPFRKQFILLNCGNARSSYEFRSSTPFQNKVLRSKILVPLPLITSDIFRAQETKKNARNSEISFSQRKKHVTKKYKNFFSAYMTNWTDKI